MQQQAARLTPKHKRKKSPAELIKPYLFLVPIFALMITFKYIPFFTAIFESFFKWNGSNVNEFIGLQNYIDLFKSNQFWISLWNCAKYCIAHIIIAVTMPLLAAELLYAVKSKRVQYVLRTVLTFPMVVPGVVVILLWQWILSGDNGVLNSVLTNIGLGSLTRPWLGDGSTALFAISTAPSSVSAPPINPAGWQNTASGTPVTFCSSSPVSPLHSLGIAFL